VLCVIAQEYGKLVLGLESKKTFFNLQEYYMLNHILIQLV